MYGLVRKRGDETAKHIDGVCYSVDADVGVDGGTTPLAKRRMVPEKAVESANYVEREDKPVDDKLPHLRARAGTMSRCVALFGRGCEIRTVCREWASAKVYPQVKGRVPQESRVRGMRKYCKTRRHTTHQDDESKPQPPQTQTIRHKLLELIGIYAVHVKCPSQ